MSTITKERAQQIFLGNGPEPTASEERELARIALASLEAEPAIHRWRRVTVEPYGPYPWHYGNFIGFSKPVEGIEDEYYYSATPAPVSVPDDVLKGLLPDAEKAEFWFEHNGKILFEGVKFNNAVFDACRAAMLQNGNPPAQSDCCPAQNCIAPALGGNSPVIADGWVACSERMPNPSTGVIVAAPWQSAPGGYAMKWATNCPGHPDADTDGWIIPGASWRPTHWMPLPAAPQQEVK
ncbi:DUF551 domain-containing protein [Enterobacter hormaechei]|uniref:DUF551 domain-containing protein n=1 Tax=Enterobacter hormaechei TaxID=158836 RepID=UPI0012F87C06|nr:DUF551 domain-containing protein [Enterobacter hormaechei]QGU37234.1 DUF551 domain-containing protein [Enterobacter hormaechei]